MRPSNPGRSVHPIRGHDYRRVTACFTGPALLEARSPTIDLRYAETREASDSHAQIHAAGFSDQRLGNADHPHVRLGHDKRRLCGASVVYVGTRMVRPLYLRIRHVPAMPRERAALHGQLRWPTPPSTRSRKSNRAPLGRSGADATARHAASTRPAQARPATVSP